MNDKLPNDPFNGIHDLYITFIADGFTENQALKLLAYMMSQMATKDQKEITNE